MKDRLKLLIISLLIIAVAAGICVMLYNAIRSVNYNKNAKNPIVTLSVEGYGDIQIELYPDYAPNTVKHFVNLVQNGFYNGKLFQSTDGVAVNAGMKYVEPTAEEAEDGAEKVNASQEVINRSYYDNSIKKGSDDDYEISIPGEFVANGFEKNTMRFEAGTIGLYRSEFQGYGTDLSTQSYNSGSSLFFILTKDDSTLNGMYTAFGKIIKGMDIIETINGLETGEKEEDGLSYFVNYPVIKTATVETYGIDYGTPVYNQTFDYNSYVSNLLMQQYSN